jgi:hypothetical protein
MMTRPLLLITHPVDLGNSAYERNFSAVFRLAGDVEHVSFAAGDLGTNYARPLARIASLLRRATGGMALRDAFARARREDRKVVIQGMSAALFTLPFRRGLRTFVILDWTRKLYEPILGVRMSPGWLTRVHRHVMLSTEALICLTDAARESLQRDYGVPEHRILRAPAPFEVEKYRVSATLGSPLRLLFVGGDFIRKGGDILLEWYARRARPEVTLTLVTQAEITPPPGVRLLKNDARAGGFTDYADYDVLAIPSRCDGYPVVLGEAASAGLAIATTANALGAPEIVEPGRNGFIAGSASEFSRLLDELIASPGLVEKYKCHSRHKMLAHFTPEACWRTIEGLIFS